MSEESRQVKDLAIEKLRHSQTKTAKIEMFSAAVMEPGISRLKNAVNDFCAGKNVKSVQIQEASDLIVCMVVYEI